MEFWPQNQTESQLLWEQGKQQFHWAMVAKQGLVSSDYYCHAALAATQLNVLGFVGGKGRNEKGLSSAISTYA